MKFCVMSWQKMSQKNKKVISLDGTICKLKKGQCMNILILENRVQNLLSSSCSPFQLYFYKNLFDPDERSKILDHQKLIKNTLETIINEIFSTDISENEYLVKNFKDEYNL